MGSRCVLSFSVVSRGSSLEITGGLEPGIRIVTAGAAYLADGMPVTLLKQTEQAEPREGDIESAS